MQVGESHIKELRQTLIKDDCYIIGCKNEDISDKARTADVTATSFKNGAEPEKVINGFNRNEGTATNLWCSDGISENGETITLKLDKSEEIHQICITFDPNLTKEHCISLSKGTMAKVTPGAPEELVKDYTVTALNNGSKVWEQQMTDNYQRHILLNLPQKVTADEIQICVTATNGTTDARIFEVRIY